MLTFFFYGKKKQTSPHSQTQNRKRKGKNFDNTFLVSTGAYKGKRNLKAKKI